MIEGKYKTLPGPGRAGTSEGAYLKEETKQKIVALVIGMLFLTAVITGSLSFIFQFLAVGF